jgi:hypothetical protein
MKKILRLIAAMIVAGTIAFWMATGANHGWTKTQVPTKIVDETTGLEGVQWQDKFVPGVDFLAAAFLGAGILAGLSFFIRTKSK